MLSRWTALILAAFLLCGPVLARTIRPRKTYFANVVIRTDGEKVRVLLDTIVDVDTPPDGVIDRWFVLQAAEPVLTPVMAHVERAQVVHMERMLSISNANAEYELVIEPAVPVDVMTTRVVGIELAHSEIENGPRMEDLLDRRGRVLPDCEWCEQQDAAASRVEERSDQR